MVGDGELARRNENAGFACVHCGARIEPVSNGSYRNHCPHCLWSLHVDATRPGDRASRCRSAMRPVGVLKRKKGWQVVHECTGCGKRQPNILALDTTQDDMDALLALMAELAG